MEGDIGLDHSEATSVILKKILHLRTKKVDTASLKTLGHMLKAPQRLTLARKFGKVLNLLDVDVQVEAIMALAQYYDPPLRCFTFQDFQLAPTLEEFEQILGLPLEERMPYRYLGHYASIQTIASVLKVHARDLQGAQQNRNGIKGFPREYLETHLHRLAQDEDWDAFIDVLALTIYGLVLFPNIEDYVDYAAVDVFLACKFRAENLVPAILADVYSTLNFCHERKGKRILCCLPMLYVWLVTHVFSRPYKTECPIADFKMYQLKTMQGREWADHLAKLDEGQIRWYPRWKDVETLIYQCGDFPNVPLMGTRGCINYNPSLVLRQLGYPMTEPPSEALTTPFVFYYLETHCLESLEKVRKAWHKVVRKGKELGVRNCGAKERYRQWVKNRVLEVKLPFKAPVKSKADEAAAAIPIEDEEMKEVGAKLAKLMEEKKKIEAELRETREACMGLKRENDEKDHNLEGANKRLKSEQDYRMKNSQCFRAANKELGLRRKERDEAWAENQQLKELLMKTKEAQKETLKQVDSLKQQMEDVVAKCKDTIKRERQGMKKEITEYQAAIKKEQEKVKDLEEHVKEQEDALVGWVTRFSRLAWLANTAVAETPWYLRRAEALLNPLSTPFEICDCIEFCKDLVGKIKRLASSKNQE